MAPEVPSDAADDGGTSPAGFAAPSPRVCPDCGNDEHQPGAEACWNCDAPLDAAPDPDRIVARRLAGSKRVRKRVWFGGSLGIMVVSVAIGWWLQTVAAAGATALVLSSVFVLTRKQWAGASIGRTMGRIAGVLTLVLLLGAAGLALVGFALYLACITGRMNVNYT